VNGRIFPQHPSTDSRLPANPSTAFYLAGARQERRDVVQTLPMLGSYKPGEQSGGPDERSADGTGCHGLCGGSFLHLGRTRGSAVPWTFEEEMETTHDLPIYDVIEDYIQRRKVFRPAHIEHTREAVARGELLLGGALTNLVDQAVLLFRAASPSVPEEFALADPYVTNGFVKSWRVREWKTVVGPGAAEPLPD